MAVAEEAEVADAMKWCASRSAAILYGKDPHFRLILA
jgi:hypothetical protein